MSAPEIIFLESCASTNRLLLEELENGAELENLHTVYTAFQSSGYGQIGNSWESEGGKNLLFSTVIHPEGVKATEQFFISEAISLAIVETLDAEAEGFSIKWPNDIYWKDKKICGILIENNICSSGIKDCVIGVGLNLNQKVFYSDAPNPVSLTGITGKEYDIKAVLESILEKFSQYYNLGLNDAAWLHSKYMERLFRFNVSARYSDGIGEYVGKIVSVEPDGHLHIIDSDGIDRRYAFKEVSYVFGFDSTGLS